MFFIDSEHALRQRFAPRRNDALLSWLRGSARNSEGSNPKVGPLNNGVGSIQIVRPSRETAIAADATIVDDGLSAARGIAVSVAFGLGFWSLIGGLVGLIVF